MGGRHEDRVRARASECVDVDAVGVDRDRHCFESGPSNDLADDDMARILDRDRACSLGEQDTRE